MRRCVLRGRVGTLHDLSSQGALLLFHLDEGVFRLAEGRVGAAAEVVHHPHELEEGCQKIPAGSGKCAENHCTVAWENRAACSW
eukprot:2551250-Rhodomonas_salina.2